MASELWGQTIPCGFFHEETHIYRDERGVIVPSSTQVFDILAMVDFSMVAPEKLEWKRGFGNAVHQAMEFLVTDDLDWDSLGEEIIAPVTGIETRLKEMKFELVATEELRIASVFGMKYGMRSDLRGWIEHRGVRRQAVLDLKTGSKFSKTWDWQLGGYLNPYPGHMGVILQVDEEGKVTPHYLVDVERAKREFQCLLAAAILKLNNGFAKLRNAEYSLAM